MVITYFGDRFLKIQYGDTVIGVNPPSKGAPLASKVSTFGADIAISTSNDIAVSGADTLRFGERIPFVIDGPGSYEVKEVFITGGMLGTFENKIESAYSINLEGMNIAILGTVGSSTIPMTTREMLSNPDILILPIATSGSLSTKDIAKLALSLEPMIIIPVAYGDNVGSAELKSFNKECGEDNPEIVEKLTLKKKDLEGKDGNIIIIKPEGK